MDLENLFLELSSFGSIDDAISIGQPFDVNREKVDGRIDIDPRGDSPEFMIHPIGALGDAANDLHRIQEGLSNSFFGGNEGFGCWTTFSGRDF